MDNKQLEFSFLKKPKVTVVCWKWQPRVAYRSTYTGEHVNILKNMVKRNVKECEVDFVCITDDFTGIDDDVRLIKLWENPVPQYGAKQRPNCFCRLKSFSEEMKSILGVDRFIWIDLDAVIVGNIDSILMDQADFKIWNVDGEKMPCNGSLVLNKIGTRSFLWDTFNPLSVHPVYSLRQRTGFMGSDQAWIAQNLSENDEFFMKKDGVYSFRCHIERENPYYIPQNAKIVFFHGEKKPWSPEVQEYDWIKNNYK